MEITKDARIFVRVCIFVVLGIIDIFLFVRMIWGPTGLMEYRDLKHSYEHLQSEVADLDKKNLALSQEIGLIRTDKAYLEKMIRQHLHYVRKNELLYLFKDLPKK